MHGEFSSTRYYRRRLYNFVSLSIGNLSSHRKHDRFESVAEDNVKVTVDQVSTVTLRFVSAVSPTPSRYQRRRLVSNHYSTVGQLISSDTIDRIPLLYTQCIDLVQLSAGLLRKRFAQTHRALIAITNISSGRPGVDVSSYTIKWRNRWLRLLHGRRQPLGIAEQNAGAIIPAMEIPEDAVDEYRVETKILRPLIKAAAPASSASPPSPVETSSRRWLRSFFRPRYSSRQRILQ